MRINPMAIREYRDQLLEILKDSTDKPLSKQIKPGPKLSEGSQELSLAFLLS